VGGSRRKRERYHSDWVNIYFRLHWYVNNFLFSHIALPSQLLGVSLSWYGYIPVEFSFSPSSATYSIDGETPISFLLKGLPVNSTTTVYNQKFFETVQLSPTSHTLKVVYEGNNSTPLTLDYLIVQNGTSSSSTTTSLPTSTGSTVSATSTPTGFVPVGPIVGGVIGGLALVVFAVLGYFLLRRRPKLGVQGIDSTPTDSTPRPFGYTPLHLSSATSNPSSSNYSQVPQAAQLGSRVTYGVKGQVGHVVMPSATYSDSIEPPSTPSGVISPTNLRAVPFQQQQRGLNLANPSSSSSSSPPASASISSAQLLPPPSKVEREAEALASLRPQRRGDPSVPSSVQSNDTWLSNTNVVLHADSGIRMPSNTTSTSVEDVPPQYTLD
jgi:hypothetical protein